MARKTEQVPAIEGGARSALLVWGGGMLVAGIALVGVGAGAEGAPLALAGLFNTVYGIHTFGRLGQDDVLDPEGSGAPLVSSMAWTGALTALAGILVALDHHGVWTGGHPGLRPQAGSWAITAYGLVALGLARVARARSLETGRKAKVEKRRHMDKSPAP